MQKSSSVLPLWPWYFIVFYPDRVIMAAVSEAFWEMQSFANDRRTAKRREQHWEHATIVTRMSYLLSLTHTFPFFSFPSFSLSDFVPFIFQPHSAPLSPFLAFLANQGSKKGWSDYCRTAEEDSEQLESPRFSQQEWPSTCLKKWTRQMKTIRDLSVGLCWQTVFANCTLTQWLHIQTENGGKIWHDSNDVFHWFIWKMSRQRSGEELSSVLPAR